MRIVEKNIPERGTAADVCRAVSAAPVKIIGRILFSGLFRHGGRGAVLGKRINLLGSVAKCGEYFGGVAAESRTRAVGGLIVRDSEGHSYGDEFADFSTLIDFYKGIAVVETLVVHNLLGGKNRTYGDAGFRQQVGDFIFCLRDSPARSQTV